MINPIGIKFALPGSTNEADSSSKSAGANQIGQQFGDMLKNALHGLENQQHTVDQLTQKAAAGDLSDIHNLMIATEKASLSVDLAVQVRNKVIDAYQEIMRMQI